MTVFDDSVHGLRARVRELEADLQWWQDRTHPSTKPGDLPLHHSQMTRLRSQILGALDVVFESAPLSHDTTAPFAGSVSDVDTWRRSVGSVHLIWEFFRDKLAQRDVAAYRLHLDAADDLAWACYKPFHDAAMADPGQDFEPGLVKEPPLVCYGTDRSPFAQARTKMLQPAGLDSKDTIRFQAVLQRLPVPVISVPWSATNHLPNLVLVGHEAGHIVAEDLGLADDITATLTAVTLDNDASARRRAAWESWGDEVWADLFGVVATGRAFVVGLASELAGDVGEISMARIDLDSPGPYPTPMLRMAICERVLDRLGIAANPSWTDAYGILVGDSHAFKNDVGVVVDALLDRAWPSLGGRTLTDVLPWTQRHEDDAQRVSEATRGRFAGDAPFDVRVWIAAAMHAHLTAPEQYGAAGLDRVLAQFIADRRHDVVRSADPANRTRRVMDSTRFEAASASDLDEVSDAVVLEHVDRQAGRELAAMLDLM